MRHPILLRREYEADDEIRATYQQVGSIDLDPSSPELIARLNLPVADGLELVVLKHPARDEVFSEVRR